MLGVRLPEELDRRLASLALETNRPKSYYVKEAILEYLDVHESTYKAIAEYERQKKAGTLKTYTLEEMKKMYDLD
ncbi:MAG: ribbon-helix-helix protein, CopG family [Proteobacteria bacterium]|jgi:RHH-type rel operon transcriptional repressor/antitoxin RelB|nr:ribbon-helix-helix protein, CopG family [Pseudomonadota bacterium]